MAISITTNPAEWATGEKIRMDTDRHIEGITELAQKGIIQYNKKSKKWRVKK